MVLLKNNRQILPLSKEMLHNLNEIGYKEMTPIQAESLPHILDGKDVIVPVVYLKEEYTKQDNNKSINDEFDLMIAEAMLEANPTAAMPQEEEINIKGISIYQNFIDLQPIIEEENEDMGIVLDAIIIPEDI